jgi:subtilisin family serine protease
MLKKLHPLAYASMVGMCALSTFSSHATNLKTQKIPFDLTNGYQHSLNAQPNEYIVVYHPNVDNSVVANAMSNINTDNGPNERALHQFTLINGFAGKVAPGQLQKLIDDPQVKTIEANLTLTTTTTGLTTNTAASWGLDRVDQTNLPLDGNYSVQGDGNGVHAYIIDSGILLSHNEFGSRAVWDYTASDVLDGNDDGKGRGTHMAGTVGGATYGVATSVNLHAVKVLAAVTARWPD